jgi:hypothetical protein
LLFFAIRQLNPWAQACGNCRREAESDEAEFAFVIASPQVCSEGQAQSQLKKQLKLPWPSSVFPNIPYLCADKTGGFPPISL